MRPKLWDGFNPTGEAKERHLQTVDCPYLTASGDDFVAQKKGPFSQVTGKKAPPVEVDYRWVSWSDPTVSPLYFALSPDFSESFKKRYPQSISAEIAYSGRAETPDMDGKGTTSFIFETAEHSGQTDRIGDLGIARYTRTFLRKGLCSFTSAIDTPANINGFNMYAAHGWGNIGYPSVCVAAQEWYTDTADGTQRTKATVLLFIKYLGAWYQITTGIIPSISHEDTGYPLVINTEPFTFVAVNQPRPEAFPHLYVSTDACLTWSPGIDLSGIFSGFQQRYGFSTEDYIYNNVGHNRSTARRVYCRQSEIMLRLRAWSYQSFGYAISSDKVVLVFGPYYNGTDWLIPAAVVKLDGTVERVHTFSAPGASEADQMLAFPTIYMFGKGAWVIELVEYRPTLPMPTDQRKLWFVDQTWITTDYGVTYSQKTTPQGKYPWSPYIIVKPYKTPGEEYKVVVPLNINGVSRVSITSDFVTYKPISKIGKVTNTEDYTALLYVGTELEPVSATPHAPWSTDATRSPPGWW